MKRKRVLFLLAIAVLLVLTGWGQKKVELLSDKKLIDLSAAIGNCKLGADDMVQDIGKETPNPSATPVPMTSVTPKPTAKPTPQVTVTPKPDLPAKPRIQEIRVRDEQITYNYVPWPDLDILAAQLRRDHDERTTFRLVDDYAEAHTFRRMLGILSDLEAEIGLKYTVE